MQLISLILGEIFKRIWSYLCNELLLLTPRTSRTLLAGTKGLEHAKQLVTKYKTGEIKHINEDIWRAKKIVDSTLHPDTGEPILLPFRMSCFVISNLIVTAGMLTPGLGVG